MGIKTTDIDFGEKEFLRQIRKMKKQPIVKIGFQGPTGDAAHGDDGLTVTDVATFNEFGTKNIPERSFIRSTMDEERGSLIKLNKQLFNLMVSGKMTTEKALNILGIKIQSLIKKKITSLKTPPNAPSTVQRKKSTNPLIDSGQMRQSVTFVVDMDGEIAAVEAA